MLGNVLDVRTALAITTAGILLAGLLLFSSPIRHSRQLPASPRGSQ